MKLGALLAFPPAADRQLLPEGRLAGPMPWVIAIMMFLTVLAAAGGLALGEAARTLGAGLADRATVQIVEADAAAREAQAAAALRTLARLPDVTRATRVGEAEMARLLAPWLGDGALGRDVPIPVLIDVTLRPGATARLPELRAALRRAAPAVRIDDHGAALAPVTRLIRLLGRLAVALVLLMATATACVVMLAARAALDTHRGTIDVMHLLGATDVQIARLFQRRMALDALFGGLIGFAAGGIVLLLIGRRLAALGSELVGAVALPGFGWAVLLLLPAGGVLLATLAARRTVLGALKRML
ncbi:cell division protein FtsX [Sphingomonas jatrophae]|uniref:Cell division transport system permease protein n=1 Tax=Sphingomonas jatrophae TaxID=1166337 RepID=A0A1I6LN23_9SPHN|nr:FtsX-like permease family protein [Sphingomonas jatrophae]SFS04896.1 cell division transport system permease protein [Sphingomonas jatrophae]